MVVSEVSITLPGTALEVQSLLVWYWKIFILTAIREKEKGPKKEQKTY